MTDRQANGDAALLTAALDNVHRYWMNMGDELREEDSLSLFRSGIAHPLLNGVTRVDDPSRVERIRAAVEQLRDIPSLWWIGPDSHPGAIDALLACGGTVTDEMPLYVRSLLDLPEAPLPDGIVIEEVSGDAAVADWVDCYAPSMGVAPEQVARMTEVEQRRADPPGSLRRFAARQDGRMVAISAMLAADGVAGIYVCSTRAPFRRQGLGAAVTLAAMRAGLEHGLAHAALQASAMGEPVYRRLGFEKMAVHKCVAF